MSVLLNITVPVEEPEWTSKPAWKLPGWAEPLVSLPTERSIHTRKLTLSVIRWSLVSSLVLCS